MKQAIPVSEWGGVLIGPNVGVGLRYGFGVTGREEEADVG